MIDAFYSALEFQGRPGWFLSDADNDDLLGVHMIGGHATELIAEASLATLLEATPWEIGLSVHPHPTISEVMGEAALAVDGVAIHI